MADNQLFDLTRLEAIVTKMRELGVTEYTDGDKTVKLGGVALPKGTEKSEAEQQAIRDRREVENMERKRRTLTGASAYIGPARPKVR